MNVSPSHDTKAIRALTRKGDIANSIFLELFLIPYVNTEEKTPA